MIYLFGAEWCANCKMVKPMLTNIEHRYIDVDTDEGVALTAKYGIRSIPALVNEENRCTITGVPRNVADIKQRLEI